MARSVLANQNTKDRRGLARTRIDARMGNTILNQRPVRPFKWTVVPLVEDVNTEELAVSAEEQGPHAGVVPQRCDTMTSDLSANS